MLSASTRTSGAVLLLLHIVRSAFATTTPPTIHDDNLNQQSTYLHFPHDTPRLGKAFLPDSPFPTGGAVDSPLSFDWTDDQQQLNHGQNPAPAYLRHPLHLPPEASRKQPLGKRDKRDIITESKAPYPPAAYIDVNNLTTIALVAQAAVARMQTWYEDGLYEWTGWWQTGVLGMAYVNLDLALGNKANELIARDVLIKNDDEGWMIDKYIDDQGWWAMYALRAYEAYGNDTWLDMVETINANNTMYWDDTCGGGVLWLTYRPLIKNTITNGLYFGILTRLYRFTGNSLYLQHATNTLNWWLTWGFEPSTGRVYDTITAPSCARTGLATWTYNSGAFLYGLADLYYATGNETLLDLGRSIAYAAIRDFSDEATGVLEESCEHDGQPSPTLPPGCQQDEVIFKGVLMMGMAELYLARPDSNIYNYINTQLLAITFNNLDSSWLFGEWWGGPWNETTAGPKTQLNALCLLSAAAMVNSDFLSRVGGGAGAGGKVGGGIATDQIAVPNNATATGLAGSTQRAASNSNSGAGSKFSSLVVVGGRGVSWGLVIGVLAGLGGVFVLLPVV